MHDGGGDVSKLRDAEAKYLKAHSAYVHLFRDVCDPTDEQWSTAERELAETAAEYRALDAVAAEYRRVNKMNWTSEWPTEPGHYWFYGWCFSDRDRPARFHYTTVGKTPRGVCYVADGYFLYKAEGAEGVWQEVQFPELPEEET